MSVIGMYVGIGLMIAGGLIFLVVRHGKNKRKNNKVSASNGSVAVGGDNSGTIINTNQSNASSGHSGSEHSWLTVMAIVIELIGIAVTIWHAYHLVGK